MPHKIWTRVLILRYPAFPGYLLPRCSVSPAIPSAFPSPEWITSRLYALGHLDALARLYALAQPYALAQLYAPAQLYALALCSGLKLKPFHFRHVRIPDVRTQTRARTDDLANDMG